MSLAFLRDTLRGTPVLLGIILRAAGRGLRAAAQKSAAPAPAAKPEGEKTAPAVEGQAGEEDAKHAEQAPAGSPWKRGKQAPAKAAPAKHEAAVPAGRSLGDLAEMAGIGFLVLVLVVVFGGMALGALGSLLAPYTSGVVLVIVVGWCFAAVMVAPRADEVLDEGEDDEVPAENDHEMAGEEPQEADPWPALCEVIRQCTEHEAAAGAAGYRDYRGRGVRLDDLVVVLQGAGVAEAVDRKSLITLLDRAGIPHREQIKFRLNGKQKPSPGVHVEDLPKVLGYRPRLPAHLVPDNTPQQGHS
ncbi:hypothetical protein ACFU6S_32630 [Streptomyces sp. NPDC057456]|uniref:hypothetical protein n=1 Tax=Streptomyces sp. NPDC057456 TaxID=3346139 RepID=UPI00367EAC23